MGAAIFADDIILLSPGRSSMKQMLKVCEYIEKTIEIRETFSFAHPEQVLRALDIFSSDCYGLMIHDLASPSTESIFTSWKTAVKLSWNVTRSKYIYLQWGESIGKNFQTLRKSDIHQILKIFPKSSQFQQNRSLISCKHCVK